MVVIIHKDKDYRRRKSRGKINLFVVMLNEVPVIGQQPETPVGDAQLQGMRGARDEATEVGTSRLEVVVGAVTEEEFSQEGESNQKWTKMCSRKHQCV